jgi:hypothetical protein
VEIPAERFAGMDWIIPQWGVGPVFRAGNGTRDHLRAALQTLSGDVPSRTVFGHTGWRRAGEAWVYLHAGGAIGAGGTVEGIDVSLPGALGRYALPRPPAGDHLATAVRASLGLLHGLTADRVAFALLAAPYRAALGETDFALHLAGPSGVFKSELASLAQQHSGAGLCRAHLPASWTSTENALEGMAFAAKDALLTVDDFAPRGSAHEVQGYHRKADRVFRSQGNRAGRQRLWADGRLRPERPPRGLVLSTGEEVPSGASVRARLLILELGPDEVSVERLTQCQRDARDGLYAEALAGYVRWLAARRDEILGQWQAEHAELRARASVGARHARTPGIVADLALGLRCFLDFARECQAITLAERDALTLRGWAALMESAAGQAEHVQAAGPVEMFLRLVVAALASGRGHLASPQGLEPHPPQAWGWQGTARPCYVPEGERTEATYTARGRRLGWVDGGDVFLEPEAVHAEAQELARQQGESLAVSARTLRKRLKERGLLASFEVGKTTTRRQLDGQERAVIHLRADTLLQQSGESGDSGTSAPTLGESPRSRAPSRAAAGAQSGGGTGGIPRESDGSPPEPPIPPIAEGGAGGGRVATTAMPVEEGEL